MILFEKAIFKIWKDEILWGPCVADLDIDVELVVCSHCLFIRGYRIEEVVSKYTWCE